MSPATAANFNDHFAAVSTAYADFRPSYPDALFDWLASIAPGHKLAWDCACGSGQASLGLAARFDRVVATDASAAQLATAQAHAGIEYRLAAAEASGLEGASVDLVSVAQALHWFDLPRFYAEVRRVLRPRGVLAVWCYGVLQVAGDTVNAQVQQFYRETVGPYWPAERAHVEAGYRDLDFPFAAVPSPTFEMSANWTLPQLLGYFRSWSATGRYIAAHGADPVATMARDMGDAWGNPESTRRVSWPLSLRTGQITDN